MCARHASASDHIWTFTQGLTVKMQQVVLKYITK